MTDTIPDEPLGSHVLELEIADVVTETEDARSLVFTGPEGRSHTGGAVALRPRPVPDAACSQRPHRLGRPLLFAVQLAVHDEAMTVTVKRDKDGYASNWLCDHAHPGMRIHVLAPSGTFVPKTLDDDFLLLSAGSGITPILSICKSALTEGGGQVVLVYANRDERSVIFADALRELSGQVPRPADRGALAGVACRGCRRRPRWRNWPPRSPTGRRSSAGRGPSWKPLARRSTP